MHIMHRCFLIFFFSINLVISQNLNFVYKKGLECFLNEDYTCAKENFENFLDNRPLQSSSLDEYATYYHFLSALKLYHPDTEFLFQNFMVSFELSSKRIDAMFFMSEYFFEKKKYLKVVDLLSDVNLYQLARDKKSNAFFYLGYSAYSIKKFDLSKNCFYELINSSDNVFKEDAIFYNSQVLIAEDDLSNALVGLKSLKDSKKYAKEVPYFISKILFDLSQYDTLISYLEPTLDSSKCNYYPSLVLLQAQAFYQINSYDPAVVYFEEYKSLVDTLTVNQIYQIGYSYYKKGLYGFAINHLNKILSSNNDSIVQYAFYYLADSYRKSNNPNEAMNAFRSASSLQLDSLIQHDAYYQFALLCYEQDNPLYNSIHYLSDFIDKYPESEHVDEIYGCLANKHLNSLNYNEAIIALENSKLQHLNNRLQYQKICFFRAVQLFNDGLYNAAIPFFDKSINVNIQNDLWYEANYWKAETYYHLNDYDNALLSYKKLKLNSELYLESLYSQAYCYLKQKNYYNSIQSFLQASKYYKDPIVLHDIYVRTGDNYFQLGKYQSAAEFFNKSIVLGGFQSDYASYQKSTSYVLLEEYNHAIESFKYLLTNFPNSNYIDDAIFDLGNLYILTQNFQYAISSFNQIAQEFPNSLFFGLSKLKLGLVYYMQKKDNQAIDILKNVLTQFPNTNISEQALGIIKNIYSEVGEANQFLDLIQNIDHDYTKSELDSSTYYSAELQYMQSNYTTSINAFKNYLSYYPQGLFFLEANYFLYKSYVQLDELEEALKYLGNIVTEKENKYTIEGVAALAEISYRLKQYISSESYYDKLYKISKTIDTKQKALLGLLESKFMLYKYNDVIKTIDKFVEEDFFSGQDNLRVHYLNAISFYKVNQNQNALLEFNWLVNNSDGELKAESYYYQSLILYNNGEYLDSQEVIFSLINELPGYEMWINNALFLLAKNYLAREDMFQAQHVLVELKKKTQDIEMLNNIELILSNNFNKPVLDTIMHKK